MLIGEETVQRAFQDRPSCPCLIERRRFFLKKQESIDFQIGHVALLKNQSSRAKKIEKFENSINVFQTLAMLPSSRTTLPEANMIISGDSLPEASDKKCNKSRKLCAGKQVAGVVMIVAIFD